jgi:heat shock protein HspQ
LPQAGWKERLLPRARLFEQNSSPGEVIARPTRRAPRTSPVLSALRDRTGFSATAERPDGPAWPSQIGHLPLASATIMVYSTSMIIARTAKFQIGQIVRHRIFSFRGVVFDIDPEFNNTEEWWLSIPEDVRPRKDQPFYHLLAENSESEYVAYVSEQNLLPDDSGEPIRHSQVAEIFIKDKSGSYRPRNPSLN